MQTMSYLKKRERVKEPTLNPEYSTKWTFLFKLKKKSLTSPEHLKDGRILMKSRA